MNIRELIKKNGISQKALSKMLKCSRTSVVHWVSGKKKPRPYIVKLIELLQEKGDLK